MAGGARITVTEAGPADRVALVPLLAEMGRHGGERTDTATLGAAAEALTRPAGRAGPFCLLARRHGAAVGLASLSGVFPARDFTWGLSLKDLYVIEAARGAGIGRALMAEAMRFAALQGYTRVDWTTEAGNAPARTFYAGLGVAPAGRILYRLAEEELAAAAQGRWPAEWSVR